MLHVVTRLVFSAPNFQFFIIIRFIVTNTHSYSPTIQTLTSSFSIFSRQSQQSLSPTNTHLLNIHWQRDLQKLPHLILHSPMPTKPCLIPNNVTQHIKRQRRDSSQNYKQIHDNTLWKSGNLIFSGIEDKIIVINPDFIQNLDLKLCGS